MKKFCLLSAVVALLAVPGLQAQSNGSSELGSVLTGLAGQFNGGDVRGFSRPASEEPPTAQTCCSTFQGFDFTGILSLSRTNTSGNTACFNCVPGWDPNNIAMNFPEARAFVGGLWSTTMTFQSSLSGPCIAVFLWVNLASGTTVQGGSTNIAECNPNGPLETVWLFEFFDWTVPNVPGDTVAVGIIQHTSTGTVDVDFEQFVIQ